MKKETNSILTLLVSILYLYMGGMNIAFANGKVKEISTPVKSSGKLIKRHKDISSRRVSAPKKSDSIAADSSGMKMKHKKSKSGKKDPKIPGLGGIDDLLQPDIPVLIGQ